MLRTENLVKFRASVTISSRQRVHSALSARVMRRFAGIKDLELAALPNGMSVRQAIHAYRQRPEVEYVEPDYIVHAVATLDDPLFPQMWNLLNRGQNGGTHKGKVDVFFDEPQQMSLRNLISRRK
jgi:hypothetical protein